MHTHTYYNVFEVSSCLFSFLFVCRLYTLNLREMAARVSQSLCKLLCRLLLLMRSVGWHRGFELISF